MNIDNLIVTDAGKELIASAIAGASLITFTKIKTSDFDYSKLEDVEIKKLTEIKQTKQTSQITEVDVISKTTLGVQAEFSNVKLEEGYYVRAIGLYIADTTKEVLYGLAVSDHACYMPKFTGKTVSNLFVKIDTIVSDSDKINMEVSPHGGVTYLQFKQHIDQNVCAESGVHGLRFFEGKLQYWDIEAGEWVDIGAGDTAPGNVTGLKVVKKDKKLIVSWADPEGEWSGTKLIYKEGSYPLSYKDGILCIDSKVQNAYSGNNGFEITGLINGTEYYIQLYPYKGAAVNQNVENRIIGTPELYPYKIMTVKIDLTNSDPATCVTYADDAVAMTAKDPAWDGFFGHYPVLFNKGAEAGKLKTTNFAQLEDGTAADITTGDAGDVMIAFPRRGVRITTVGDILTVSMTDDPDSPDFDYYAHVRGTERRDKFYLGAYLGYIDAFPKLRSCSGKPSITKTSIKTFRSLARANGQGYDQSGFYQLLYRQCAYVLKYKNLNSQAALGRGCILLDNTNVWTGSTNMAGMDFGETTGRMKIKLFGVEDVWGAIGEWIDGVTTDRVPQDTHIFTATDNNFNSERMGYSNQGLVGRNLGGGGHISKVMGTSAAGFMPSECLAIKNTFFCDFGDIGNNSAAHSGTLLDDGTGVFTFRLWLVEDEDKVNNVSARLMYL